MLEVGTVVDLLHRMGEGLRRNSSTLPGKHTFTTHLCLKPCMGNSCTCTCRCRSLVLHYTLQHCWKWLVRPHSHFFSCTCTHEQLIFGQGGLKIMSDETAFCMRNIRPVTVESSLRPVACVPPTTAPFPACTVGG